MQELVHDSPVLIGSFLRIMLRQWLETLERALMMALGRERTDLIVLAFEEPVRASLVVLINHNWVRWLGKALKKEIQVGTMVI
jgi:hypothetical protein